MKFPFIVFSFAISILRHVFDVMVIFPPTLVRLGSLISVLPKEEVAV